MRAVVQRVRYARVTVDAEVVGQIGHGLLVLLGVGQEDRDSDVEYLAHKVVHLRIFEDEQQHMNRSVLDVSGSLLVVSQFTLYGDCRKGRRPAFVQAMEPAGAEALCDAFATACRGHGVPVETGRFRAMMDVELCNSGPVTMLLDSKRAF